MRITPQYQLYFLFSCCVLLLVNVQFVQSNDMVFFKIGAEQGLSQLSVVTIYQDEEGAMWFGTREGVNRYNGNSMEVFRPHSRDSNSLTNNVVKSIQGDRNGNVYIMTETGINRYHLRESRMSVIQRTESDAIVFGRRHLWIAENNIISFYDNKQKMHFITLNEVASPITALYETSDQQLIAGTVSSGLWIIDQHQRVSQLIRDCGTVSSIFEDTNRNIWVGTWKQGLFRISPNGEIINFSHNPAKPSGISSDFVRTICQDNQGTLWIGTRKGLEKFNSVTYEFVHFNSETNSAGLLTNESVWSLYKDQQGTLWVGTYFGGINYFNPTMDFYTQHDLRNGYFLNKPFPVIGLILEDKKGRLILGTEGDGLIIYDRNRKTYQNIRGNVPGGISSENIKSFYYDKSGDQLWIGTHLGGLTLLDLNTLTTTQYRTVSSKSIQSDNIRSIYPFENDLLIATNEGLFRFNKSDGSFSIFSKKIHEQIKFVLSIAIKDDELWVGGQKLYSYHLKTGRLRTYEHNVEDKTSLSSNVVTRILIDSKNRIWIGTSGGGVNLFVPSNQSFVCFNSETVGLLNDYVSNIAESASGNLLIATTRGLSILNADTREVRNFSPETGFPLNSLYNGGMATMSDKEVFVAGMNGMISFFEDKLHHGRQYFNLNLVNLWINNKLVKPADETGVLKQALAYTRIIRLKHSQSMITLEFATNNYISLNQPEFQYKLEELSDTWTILPAATRMINFMNIRPGDYKLVLRAIYPGEDKVVSSTTLQIVILPPLWGTWYAYIFYLLVIGFIVWRYVVFSRSRLLLSASLEYEKREKKHIEEVNHSKLRFFTNISHEFRTPLTLIAGQIDMMLQMSNVNPLMYNKILNVKRNTQNMQHLINELLEFRKTEQGHLNLRVSNHNVVRFLHEIFLSFTDYANHKHINYQFKREDEFIELWYDKLQLQKVFYNIISNAFKYTPTEGEIIIRVIQSEQEVVVEVKDTGVGVSASDIGKIFDRFYQAENGLQASLASPGTGIGLALSKSILEAHSANIQVSSESQQGSCFAVSMKKGRVHFSDDQIIEAEDESNVYDEKLLELDQDFIAEIIASQVVDNKPRFSILIVEDNEELRELLKTIFESIYVVLTACDGQQGLEMTIEHQPDIVLSDLMMPRLSGAEMCSKIKGDFLVSHIPVVLLTAQTAIEYNIEGLRLGADDYITKPFNVKALITRCNNLVNSRRMMQEKYSRQIDFSPLMLATNKIDSEFIEKAHQIIEKHIDNSDFDVKLFSEELGLSRTGLFTKLKGVTGQTPNEFIMNVRMKKAAEMLQYHPEQNISDITYMLGFNTPRYFSKCFKDQFSMTPMAYRKQFHAEYTANEKPEE